MPRLARRAPDTSASGEPAKPTSPRAPTMTPFETKLFEALNRAPGQPVACMFLAELLYGDAEAASVANTMRMIANLKLVLRAQGTTTIVSHGWRSDLAYALAPAEITEPSAPVKAMPPRRIVEAPAPGPAKVPLARLPAGTVTLPPCGYAAWTYRENGDHAVRLQGEDRIRVLTPADQRFRSLTTERGTFEQAEPAAEGA